MRWLGLVAIASILACGPSIDLDENASDDATGDAGTTGASATAAVDSTGDASTTTSTTTTSTTTTTTTTSGSSDEGSTGEPESICDPQPVPVVAGVSVQGAGNPTPQPVLFTSCFIVDLSSQDDQHTIALDCAEGQPTVQLAFQYPLGLDPGAIYELRIWWTVQTFSQEDLLLSLREIAGPLAVVAGASPVLPGEGAIPADGLAPVMVERLGEVCPVEPEVETDFIGDCFETEREALRISVEGDTVDVYDGGQQFVGVHHMAVVRYAEERHDIICSDTPGRWYQWVVAPPFLR